MPKPTAILKRVIIGLVVGVISFLIVIIVLVICLGIGIRITMPIANFLHFGRGLRLLLLLFTSVAVFILIWLLVLAVVACVPAAINILRFCKKYYHWHRFFIRKQNARTSRLKAYLSSSIVSNYQHHYRLALYAESSGNLKAFEEHLLQALTSITGTDRLDLAAHIYSRLIKCCRLTDNVNRFDQYAREFDKTYEAVSSFSGRSLAQVYIEAGYLHHRLERFGSALWCALMALYRSLSPTVIAEAFNLIGLSFAHCGDQAEAYKYFEAALATCVSGDVRIRTLINKAKCDLHAKNYSLFYEALDAAREVAANNQMRVVADIQKFRTVIAIEVQQEVMMSKVYDQRFSRVIHKIESWDKARGLTSEDNIPELTQMLENAAADLASRAKLAIDIQTAQSSASDLQTVMTLVKKRIGPVSVLWKSVEFWSEAAAIDAVERNNFWQVFKKVPVGSAFPFVLFDLWGEVILKRSFGYRLGLGAKQPTEETLEQIEKKVSEIKAVLKAIQPKLEVGTSAALRSSLLTVYSEVQNALAVWSTECFKRTGKHSYRDAAWTALQWTRGYQLSEAIGFTDETECRLSVESAAMSVLESCREQVVLGKRPEFTESQSEQFFDYLDACLNWQASTFRPEYESLEVLQSKLQNNILWLIFVIQDDSSFVWRVTHKRIEVAALPSSEILANVISRITEYISSPPLTNQFEYSHQTTQMNSQLSRLILGNDIDPNISRIIISPDGPCWNLPFEALPCPGTDQAIGSLYEIVWSVGNDNPYEDFYLRTNVEQGGFALIGDPIYPLQDSRFQSECRNEFAGPSLTRLPFSADEINRIHDRIRHFGTSQILTGENATVLNTVESLKKHDVVHIACHAISNGDEMLCLSCVDADGKDTKMTWSREEIRRNKFAAKVVTLSACATSAGQVKAGEGPYSLGRAFLEAGIPTVLVTSWLISDEATAAFMEAFYNVSFAPTNVVDLSEGLRYAREMMLREKKWRHPYFWACYRLMVAGVSVKNAKMMPVGVDSKAFATNTN